LEQEIYLTHYLDNAGRDRLVFLKSIVFVGPSTDNIELLVSELRSPLYGEYHLCKQRAISKLFLMRRGHSF
jgi:vacuolar protein sorting-associated protein 45